VKEIAVKKYVVKLSEEERERLETLIRGGKHPARKLTRARILLKADAGEAGEGWSDSQIAAALDIGLATVARVRRQLVEEGFDSVLTPKRSPASARPRIFDRASEAKLIALACSEPPPLPFPALSRAEPWAVSPKGRARWTLSLLEDKVVELKIVARASDNTIGRTYPNVSKIVLVQDNLNTHKPASLYEAFPAGEARRLVERFEWHYTPKHGSWLDMAESELSVVSCQCLDRRIPDKQTLVEEVAAWEHARNKHHAKADWQFTTADARIKLKRLYPTL